MILLFEEYHYPSSALQDILPDEFLQTLRDGRKKPAAVGYFYSSTQQEAVFVLPKVFLQGEKAFALYAPEELLDGRRVAELAVAKPNLFRRIFALSLWHYQSIRLYQEDTTHSSIPFQERLPRGLIANGSESKTLLDIVLALIDFARAHRQLIAHLTILQHAGHRKIHWAKTISRTLPIAVEGKPYYTNLISKGKQRDWDEELIVLFYSVLQYLQESLHFEAPIDFNYNLYSPREVERLLYAGRGLRILRRIRKRYFAQELVKLWKLLHSFFSWQACMSCSSSREPEYLLIKDYHCVWERMVASLLGAGLCLATGKRIDHAFKGRTPYSCVPTYYIADSKYYKPDEGVDPTAIDKQFFYARQVNWELLDEDVSEIYWDHELTEGYLPIPNFLIRGYIPNLDDTEYGGLANAPIALKCEGIIRRCQFPNRLFDRDTLLVFSYSINYLYVLASYVRSNAPNGIPKASAMRAF